MTLQNTADEISGLSVNWGPIYKRVVEASSATEEDCQQQIQRSTQNVKNEIIVCQCLNILCSVSVTMAFYVMSSSYQLFPHWLSVTWLAVCIVWVPYLIYAPTIGACKLMIQFMFAFSIDCFKIWREAVDQLQFDDSVEIKYLHHESRHDCILYN